MSKRVVEGTDLLTTTRLNLIKARNDLLKAYAANISPSPTWRGSLPSAILKEQLKFVDVVITSKRILGNEKVERILINEDKDQREEETKSGESTST